MPGCVMFMVLTSAAATKLPGPASVSAPGAVHGTPPSVNDMLRFPGGPSEVSCQRNDHGPGRGVSKGVSKPSQSAGGPNLPLLVQPWPPTVKEPTAGSKVIVPLVMTSVQAWPAGQVGTLALAKAGARSSSAVRLRNVSMIISLPSNLGSCALHQTLPERASPINTYFRHRALKASAQRFAFIRNRTRN